MTTAQHATSPADSHDQLSAGLQTKRVEWSDLTPDQLALRDQLVRQGINPTPDMILKIGSGEIKYKPPPSSFDGEIAATHHIIELKDGRKFEVLETRAIEVGLGSWNKPNPNFPHLWDGKNTTLAYCIPKDYLSLTTHGGTHVIKEPLRSDDVKDWAANSIAYLYRDRPELPKQFKFTKDLRKKIGLAHSRLRGLARQNQVQTVTRQSPRKEPTG